MQYWKILGIFGDNAPEKPTKIPAVLVIQSAQVQEILANFVQFLVPQFVADQPFESLNIVLFQCHQIFVQHLRIMVENPRNTCRCPLGMSNLPQKHLIHLIENGDVFPVSLLIFAEDD